MPMPAHELAFDAPLQPAPMLRQDLDSQAADALLAMSGAPQAEDQKPSHLSRSSGGGGDGGEMHSGDGGFHMGDPQHGGVPPLPGLDMAGSGGAAQVRSQPTDFRRSQHPCVASVLECSCCCVHAAAASACINH